MSQQDGLDDASRSPLDRLERWYHVPALLGILVFMLWTRVQSYNDFVVNGQVYFRGNDPWYHFRETSYLLENWPTTMPFDPWTGFPFGTQVGQFGTLWDHLIAIFIVLGSPITGGGEEGAMRVMLVMAALFGTLVGVPTYLIARRFVDRFAAVMGVVVLGLLPGTFFSYTLVGFPDHSAGEIFFQTLAVLAFLVAFGVAEREKPVWELVVDRDWTALKRPALYAGAAGVALGLYMWTWQPGVLMVGFTGIFLAIKITSDVYHGTSPEPAVFAGTVGMTVAGLMQVIPLDNFSFVSSQYSLLQIVLPLGVALGAVFLAWLARQWETREINTDAYPPTVGGLILASAGFVWLAIPSLWSTLTGNLLNFVGFSATAQFRTIGEAQPPLQQYAFADFVLSQYGLAFFVALLAILYILARPLVRSGDLNRILYPVTGLAVVGSVYAAPNLYDAIGGVVGVSWQVIGLAIAAAFLVGATFLAEYDTQELYFVVWAAFIGSAAFTQTRFNYYLAVIVAVGSAYAVQLAIDALDLNRPLDELRDVEGWQVMTIAAVFVILIAPLVFVATPVWAAGQDTGPGNVVQWDESLQWMNEETPEPGELGGADNAMEYYGTYERPADDDFDYPEGAYGVQSWWDYGHWITTRAERIPNANPFQQNAVEAADYLLADSEERAHEVWASQSDEGANTRYVMVDSQMVSPYSKFNAPVTFYSGNETAQDFNRAIYQQTEQGGFRTVMQLRTQRYHESQMVRLYEHYGSAVDPQPVVVDWEPQAARNADGERIEVATLPSDLNATVQRFDNVSAARAYVEEDGSAQVGGVGTLPSERVDALEHYRLVHATDARGQDPTGRQVNVLSQLGVSPGDLFGEPAQTLFSDDFVKTFERVPGATIEGSGAEPGTEVRAAVRMEKPTGETFVYQQYAEADANGEFEFRVPYSTTGYDEYGPEEGYTNTSVRATGPYEVTTGVASGGGGAVPRADRVNVTEAQVIGEDDAAATVELEPLIPEDGGDDSGNETDGGGNETAAIDAPADSGVPAATALSSTAPVDTAPIDTAPVDTAPIDTAPIDAATPGVARALPRTVP